MSLDDTLMDLWITDPYKTAYTKALPVAKEAILTDLLEMLQDEYLEKYVSSPDKELRNIRLEKRRWANLRNQLRQELRNKVRKYCE